MNRFLRYFCGCALMIGVLLVPTGNAESNSEPARQHETTVVQQSPEAPAPQQDVQPAP